MKKCGCKTAKGNKHTLGGYMIYCDKHKPVITEADMFPDYDNRKTNDLINLANVKRIEELEKENACLVIENHLLNDSISKS